MTAWLDMSLYPEGDPDAVLTPDESHLLRGLFDHPVPNVPDDVWHRMLDITWTTVADGDVDGDADVDVGYLDDPVSPEHQRFDGGAGIDDVVTEGSGSHTLSAFLDHDSDHDHPDCSSDEAW